MVVSQAKYLEAALTSALCLRQHDSKTPITIISDLPILNHLAVQQYGISPRLLEPAEIVEIPFFSRYLKTKIGSYSPYRETLYLDADILPINDISELWSYLNHGDLAMVEDLLPQIKMCGHVAPEEVEFTLRDLPGETTQYNSGVMLWRNTPKIKAFFAKWHAEWLRFQKHDQLALVRAIAQSQLSIAKIPKSYNTSPRDAEPLIKQGERIHMLHLWGGKVASGRFSKLSMRYCPEAVKAVANVVDAAKQRENLLTAGFPLEQQGIQEIVSWKNQGNTWQMPEFTDHTLEPKAG